MKLTYLIFINILYLYFVSALNNIDEIIKQCYENYGKAINSNQFPGFNFNLCSNILLNQKYIPKDKKIKNLGSYKQILKQVRNSNIPYNEKDSNTNLNKRQDNDDSISCNVAEFGECAIAINLKSADNLCKENGKCPESLMEKYQQCYKEIYNNTNDDIAILDQPYYKALGEVGLSYSFICSKSGDEWCYDTYKNAVNNSTLMHNFMCSECGKIAFSHYKLLYSELSKINKEEYQKVQQYIDEYNTCSGGEFFNNYIDMKSFIVISVIITFLMLHL